MSISASMVKELRERTGAGMMECKKALVEANGDLDAAAEALRKSGQAKADKKAGRVAADGRVVIANDGNKAVIVEVNSETDFVAKDENFINFAEKVASAVAGSGETDVAVLASQDIGDGRSIEQARTDLVQKVGENISVRRAAIVVGDGPIAFLIQFASQALRHRVRAEEQDHKDQRLHGPVHPPEHPGSSVGVLLLTKGEAWYPQKKRTHESSYVTCCSPVCGGGGSSWRHTPSRCWRAWF